MNCHANKVKGRKMMTKISFQEKISGNQAEMKKCLDFIPKDKEVDDKSLKRSLKEKSKD